MADMTGLGSKSALDDRRVSQIASRALDDAKQMGGEMLAVARDSVVTLADEQRRRAADQIAAVAEAVRSSADALGRDTGLPLANYGNEAASRIDDFAQTVRSREWGKLAEDIEGFGRAQPMAFIAAALGIGFLAGRFLFAAPPRSEAHSAPASLAPTQQSSDPHGGVRHDYGAVSGPVSGNVRAGYGTAREGGA